MRKYAVCAIGLLLIGLGMSSATAAVGLSYVGAFKAGANVWDGDLAYNPGGNGGAGSLFVTDGSPTGRKELNEVTVGIPSLDRVHPGSATVLHSWDCPIGISGLTYSASDGNLYTSNGGGGSEVLSVGRINTDGTGENDNVVSTAWTSLSSVGGLIDTTSISGYDKIVVGTCNADPKDVLMYAVNTTTGAKKAIVKYDAAHLRPGFVSGSVNILSAELIQNGSDSAIVVSNKVGSDNTLMFYNLSDIVNATTPYDAVPYTTLTVQDKMLGSSGRLFGLAYDSMHKILYGAEGAYGQPTYIQAWSVVPEPATLCLLTLGGLAILRRRSA